MRTFAKVCNITAIVFLTIATVIQGFAVHAVGKSNVTALTENRWLMPVWIAALVLLPVALVLGMLFKKKERINLLPSSSSLSAIRVVSSEYLRLLRVLLAS